MGPSLDIYAEIDHLPLTAVLALVCASTEAPEDDTAVMDTTWDAAQEFPTEVPPN
jgi:hypothetical protein